MTYWRQCVTRPHWFKTKIYQVPCRVMVRHELRCLGLNLHFTYACCTWFSITLLTPSSSCSENNRVVRVLPMNSLRPIQNRRHSSDDVSKCNFIDKNVWIPIKISLKFVPKGSINNIPALVQIMAWRRTGDKPLSEPMMTQFNDAYMRYSGSMS